MFCSTLQYVAVCCSVLQCVAVCCNVLQCVAGRHGRLVTQHASIEIGFCCVRYRALLCATQGSFWWKETRVSSFALFCKRALHLIQKSPIPQCRAHLRKRAKKEIRVCFRKKSPVSHTKEPYTSRKRSLFWSRNARRERRVLFATHRNTQQHKTAHTATHTATHYNTQQPLQHTHTASAPSLRCHPLQHKATHCNAHCNTQGNTLQHAATHLHSVMLGSSASGPRYSPFHTHDSHSSWVVTQIHCSWLMCPLHDWRHNS